MPSPWAPGPDPAQHAIRARGNVLRNHFPIGREAAVGDHHGLGGDALAGAVTDGIDADASAVLDGQRFDPDATHHGAATFREILLQPLHEQVGATILPIQPCDRPPRRRQHFLSRLIVLQRALYERRALLRQPIDSTLAVSCERAGHRRMRVCAVALHDGAESPIRLRHDRQSHDIADAGRKPRAARITLFAARFENCRRQSRLHGAARGDQPGKTAADGDDVKLHWRSPYFEISTALKIANRQRP